MAAALRALNQFALGSKQTSQLVGVLVIVVVVVVAKVVEGALVAVFARARLVEAKVHLDSSLIVARAARCLVRDWKGGRAHDELRVGMHIAQQLMEY